jgi:arginase
MAALMAGIAVLEAPSALGQVPEHRGVELAPARLLEEGIAEGLGAVVAGRVEAPGYSAARDPETQVMNVEALVAYSSRLADAVGAIVDAERFALVLGGDCSILLGTMLGLRRRGRYGLLYIDGHADFWQPERNPIEGAASASDLGFVTGYGPRVLTELEGYSPLVDPRDVVVFGNRDRAERSEDGCRPLPEEMGVIGRDRVHTLGVETAMAEALALLQRGGEDELDGFWIHLDADVLDEAIMQAVDDPQPDGLMWGELASALAMAIGSGGALGLQITIYNPDFDQSGANGRGLATTVNTVLSEFT